MEGRITEVLLQRRSDNRAPLRHYFYIPRPRSHINLDIEYNFNYMKGAQRRTDVVPPLVLLYQRRYDKITCAFGILIRN